MCSDIAITIKNVGKTYWMYNAPLDRLKQVLFPRKKYHTEVQAIKDVSLVINRGETVGLVGRNGSGKSTLLQMVCGTLQPSHGTITTNGRISALLELGAGFDPELSGKENVFLNASILGLTSQEIKAKYSEILEFAGIGEAIHQPIKTYSSGMSVRLAFAIAVVIDPDILVVDEALAVGDEAFQRKCYARIRDIQQRGGTILLVSHAAGVIMELCNRVVLMEKGEMKAIGLPKIILNLYHKLIYAPKEKEGEILSSLISQVVSMEARVDTEFDPDMQPQSRVEYESHGALITNPRIKNKAGENVNLLKRGETYRYSFEVDFSVGAQQVRCGMMIKTLSGLELGGSSTASAFKQGLALVEKGEKLQVTFEFQADLFPGVYFLNCGCSGVLDNKMTYLHRITDAMMFRVIPEGANAGTGTVDFKIKPEVKRG
jgi:lipopolysaccharide transport system ATP-binding protein